ncbi:2,3-butanediol dehydrogenase [Bacillaceae bacterium SIJ1]|uniref:2,3-butanediol dehydrogenase n=1 Tax=Litoribacterium kuwaitense TaxID=1398745 RepID=UPI0013ED6EF3|nr:2,3-butanediol dehydrogenase [Litoribacterium kuwaitense]NGP44802.1 2,3-butanediol dehydrogenase [Litoribacterium kuwaitense]
MKAAVWHAAKDLRVEEVNEPNVVSSRDVKVKVKWCGICGSDLHEYLAGPIFIPTKEPHPISKDIAPVIMGHEFAGEVVAVGEDVTRVNVGDRVAIEPLLAPYADGEYKEEKYNLSPYLGFHGLSGGGGGFSEFTVVGDHMVHKLPDELSYEQGALVEPAAVALHSVRVSSLKAGDTAVVFGAGPIGLLVIEALKAGGASKIFAVELSDSRKALAEELGAHVIDPSEVDPVEEIHRLTNDGVDVAFEVTGIPAVLKQTINSTHTGGEAVIVSIWESDAPLQPNDIVIKERTVKGVIGYRNVYPAVMELMKQGYFSGEKLITKKIELDQVVEEGFEQLVADKSQVKILVKPE